MSDLSNSVDTKHPLYKLAQLMEEFEEDYIWGLTFRYNHNPNGSDYECVFCNNREAVPGRIDHEEDCWGERFKKAFYAPR